MKKNIFILALLIILNIIIVFLIFSNLSKEKVLIEDKFVLDNHYVGMILTTKRNIYIIDKKYKNYNNLKDNSSYLIKSVNKKDSKMTYEDFQQLKKSLKSLKYDNPKCQYSDNQNNRTLIYYDYKHNKKIILAGKPICQNQDIIELVQKYYMWTNDV